ncbi:DUF488 family protein [Blastopirellula sp. J2-11]|uniref:DUF488 domain-containing protein n=1 Tax=Blastopirellula sp. J2-11 TaxID=2943192 RepID=UPI0021C893AB|nr:DUF488 family protein [Blastopirellula sp. J2-11]UUO07809.1 DUF488 family protein [Blastopirellula sp. J2-11]
MIHQFQTKRIYDPPSKSDGLRVLADRLWPRGVSKAAAKIDVWAKELTPSNDLRKWLHADPQRYEDFVTKYKAELNDRRAQIKEFLEQNDVAVITLVTATKDLTHGHIAVLQAYLEQSVSDDAV